MRTHIAIKAAIWKKVELLANEADMKPLEFIYSLIEEAFYKRKFENESTLFSAKADEVNQESVETVDDSNLDI